MLRNFEVNTEISCTYPVFFAVAAVHSKVVVSSLDVVISKGNSVVGFFIVCRSSICARRFCDVAVMLLCCGCLCSCCHGTVSALYLICTVPYIGLHCVILAILCQLAYFLYWVLYNLS